MIKNYNPQSLVQRQRAEVLLKNKHSKVDLDFSEAEMHKLIHELEVHQVELEMQNEELILAQEQATIASEKYIELYDFAPSGYFTLSPKGEIIQLNLAGAAILGKDRSQLKNRLFHVFVADNFKPFFLHFLENVFRGNEKEICELTLSTNSDKPVYAYITGINSKNGGNCFLTVIDITERKQAEEALKTREIKYHAIFENVQDVFYQTDFAGTVLEVSPSIENFTGFSRDEIIGEPIAKLFLDFNSRDMFFYKLKEKGEIRDYELRLKTKTGEFKYTSINVRLIFNTDGLPNHIDGAIRDITQRKLAQVELQASKEFLKNIVNAVASPVFVKDDNHKYVLANNALCSLLKIPKEKIIGSTDSEYFPEEQLKVFIEKDNEVFKTGRENINEEYLTDGTGNIRTIVTRKTLYTDTAGNKFLVGIFNDITERKLAEKRIQRLTRVYSVLSNINQTIVRNRDKQLLFDEVCRITVDDGGFLMTWIGVINSKTNKVDVMASSGKTGEYLNNINIDLNDKALGSGPSGLAIKSGKYFYSNNIETDEIMIPWRKNAKKYGYQSSIALPLIVNGETIGAYTIYSGEIGFFNDDEIKLLEELAFDISFALEFIESEKERKQAEKALRKSEAIQSKIVSNIGDVIVIIDQNGNNRYKSPNIETLFGWKPEELVGKSTWDIVHPDDLDSSQKIIAEIALLPNATATTEIRYRRKDGVYVWIEITLVNLLADPDIQGFLGNYHDITERRLVQEKIREKDNEFRKLSSNLPDLIYQFTRRPDGTYYVPIASEGIKNIFGCSPEDVIDDFTPIGRVIHPDDAERVIADIEYSAKHLTYFTCEFRVQIPGKPIQWIYSKSTPEKLADGIITWYGFNADITERKQAEEELIKAKEKAEESDRLKSAFLTNMSHEIRTPMNGILGFTGLLLEPDLTGDQKEAYIKIVNQSGQRMLNTVNDIVEISKIEAGIVTVNLMEVNVQEHMDELIRFFTPEATKNGLKLSLEKKLPKRGALITTDQNKLDSILTNLIKNAIKYTPAGKIKVGYHEKENMLEFYVKDTGIGIPAERQKVVFERFIQADITTTRQFEGSGLGLAITKAYVEMLGGEIRLESQTGEGSTFFFTLPLNGQVLEETGEKETGNQDEKTNPVKRLNIVIAEDDETSAFYLKTIFKNGHNKIILTKNGHETVEVCRNNPDIDLVLMDIQMPVMNGYDATRKIRTFNKNVIIIAQTAFALEGDNEKVLEAGCNDYISKPINKYVLMTLIQKNFENN